MREERRGERRGEEGEEKGLRVRVRELGDDRVEERGKSEE